MSACNLRPPEQQLITASARGSALEAKNDFAERSLYKTEKSRNHFLRPAPAAAFSNLRQRAFCKRHAKGQVIFGILHPWRTHFYGLTTVMNFGRETSATSIVPKVALCHVILSCLVSIAKLGKRIRSSQGRLSPYSSSL